jgi:hypothetical protein
MVSIDTKLLGAVDSIEKAGENVIERGRKPRLPREPVIEREHLAPSRLREEGTEPVVRLDAADLPAAAVNEDGQARRVGELLRLVQTRPPVVASAPHDQVSPVGVSQMAQCGGPLQPLEQHQLAGGGRIPERRQRAAGGLGEKLQAGG